MSPADATKNNPVRPAPERLRCPRDRRALPGRPAGVAAGVPRCSTPPNIQLSYKRVFAPGSLSPPNRRPPWVPGQPHMRACCLVATAVAAGLKTGCPGLATSTRNLAPVGGDRRRGLYGPSDELPAALANRRQRVHPPGADRADHGLPLGPRRVGGSKPALDCFGGTSCALTPNMARIEPGPRFFFFFDAAVPTGERRAAFERL